mgnify:CR=1 FL=1
MGRDRGPMAHASPGVTGPAFDGYDWPPIETFLSAASFSGAFSDLEVIGVPAHMIDCDMAGGTFTVVPEPASMTLMISLALPVLLRKR